MLKSLAIFNTDYFVFDKVVILQPNQLDMNF